MENNLHNALTKMDSGMKLSPDFTAMTMARIQRRVRRKRIISIVVWSFVWLLIAATAGFFLYPVLLPLASNAHILSISGICAMLCALLVIDGMLRKKYMPDKFG